MLSICLADGDIEQKEIEMMAAAYAEIMNQPADLDLLQGLAQEHLQQLISSDGAAISSFDHLISRLDQERSLLDDNGREMILESAFRVACADGIIQDSERKQLREIARALAINEGVLELEISQFQRDMRAASNGPLA
jgi:DnaJ-domain-containing protein 1